MGKWNIFVSSADEDIVIDCILCAVFCEWMWCCCVCVVMEREVFCWRYCHSVKAASTPEHWSVEEETRIAIRCSVGSNAFLLP